MQKRAIRLSTSIGLAPLLVGRALPRKDAGPNDDSLATGPGVADMTPFAGDVSVLVGELARLITLRL